MKKLLVYIKSNTIELIARLTNALNKSHLGFVRLLYRLVNHFNERCFHISSFSVLGHNEYKLVFGGVDTEVLYNDRTGYTSNLVYNDSDEEQKLIPIPMDDVVLYHYKDIMLCGDSDLLIDKANNVVINNLCYNKADRIVYHDSIKLAQDDNTILIRYQKNLSILESGIVISGLFSKNYYHSLYDNLVRLLAIKKTNIPDNTPFLIDKTTVDIASLKTAFDCLSKDFKREIIVLEPRKQYHVKNLYYISHINFIIPSIKSYELCQPTDTVFDLNLTMKMREQLLKIKSDKVFPEKFFISRKQTSRRNFNEDEVYNDLKKEGFERVFPENLTFEEQIALFNNAKYIVGGGGAAMTNLMFCNSQCKVLIINKTMDQVPCFTTVPYAIGVTIRHYGQMNEDKRLHSDYYVNSQNVIKYLKLLG